MGTDTTSRRLHDHQLSQPLKYCMERVNTDSFELHLLEISKRINVNSEYEELTSALITTKHPSTEQAPNVVSGSVKRSRYIC